MPGGSYHDRRPRTDYEWSTAADDSLQRSRRRRLHHPNTYPMSHVLAACVLFVAVFFAAVYLACALAQATS